MLGLVVGWNPWTFLSENVWWIVISWAGLCAISFLAFFLWWHFPSRVSRGKGNNQHQAAGMREEKYVFSPRRVLPGENSTRFSDVAGVDEAIEELEELSDFLRRPERYRGMGARIPRGVLLFGPPGTGKTLLARALAGEAGVPFFFASASDFVEKFVGVGASRVRILFEEARREESSIVFLDELDAVGSQRGDASLSGGEREQTLNQLLVEMDGFEARDNVIVISATNRVDMIDHALLRPGRFDRRILVDRPDRNGRLEILKIHARNKKLASGVELETLAAETTGLSGADLENAMNEAAILAVRRDKPAVTPQEIQDGVERVMAGPERRSRVLSEEERKVVAYHELGHALVGHYRDDDSEIHKISLVSRGQALGYTISLPREDHCLRTRSKLIANMAMMLGGRAAEELVFQEVTDGATSDLERVTLTATQMVTRCGMSSGVGLRFVDRQKNPDSGRSEKFAREVDEEIRRTIDEAYRIACEVLEEHEEDLHRLSGILIERETIGRDQFERLLAGEPEERVFQ